MSFFIVAALLLFIIVLGILAIPLLRNENETEPTRKDFDLSLYKDQLAEIDSDMEQGLIKEEQARGARTELQRRLLAAEAADEAAQQTATSSSKGMFVAVAAFVLVVSIGVYWTVGSPGRPDLPIAMRNLDQERDNAQINQMKEMVATLAERLKAEPENHEGWQMLGRSYRAMDRFQDAADAFKKAVELSKGAAEDLTN